MSKITVSVSAAHIADAKPTPSHSPIALALREMGFTNATVTHHYAYFGSDVYPLPEQAIASEQTFDFLAKGGALQGEIIENIYPYQFEIQAIAQGCVA